MDIYLSVIITSIILLNAKMKLSVAEGRLEWLYIFFDTSSVDQLDVSSKKPVRGQCTFTLKITNNREAFEYEPGRII